MRTRAAVVTLVLLVGCSSDDGAPPCDTCNPDPLAPKFAGVVAVAPDAAGTNLRVSWAPATDDITQPAAIRYRVYTSVTAGRATSRAAVFTTAPGATSAYVQASPPGVVHYVVVRAVDGDGREEKNVVEKSTVLAPDLAPPSFAGIKSAQSVPDAGITLNWDAASDTQTQPEGMRYVVYGGTESVDLSAPLAELENVTTVTLNQLGTPNAKRRFLVRAKDAAGNFDNNNAVTDGTLGPDARPPQFAGCSGVTAGSKALLVSWAAATDESTAASAISYEIFVATSAGGQAFGGAPKVSVKNRTSLFVRDLVPATAYYVVCRARDEAGNSDQNTAEKNVTTKSDATAPTFAGITTSAFDGALRTITLNWDPATDDQTPQGDLVYDVFERLSTGTFDYSSPRASSAPGATTINVTGLPSNTALAWTVRARDAALNSDTNTVEIAGKTVPSFASDVQPIFSKNCAVVGCHTSSSLLGGMSLSPSVAYDNLVNMNANQRPPGRPTPIARIFPGDLNESYLYLKVMGVAGTFVANPMPAPGTGNTLSDTNRDILKNWILGGAPRN